VEDSGEIAGVDWRKRLCFLSPAKLVDGLNRVFPFDMTHKEAAKPLVNMVLTFRRVSCLKVEDSVTLQKRK